MKHDWRYDEIPSFTTRGLPPIRARRRSAAEIREIRRYFSSGYGDMSRAVNALVGHIKYLELRVPREDHR